MPDTPTGQENPAPAPDRDMAGAIQALQALAGIDGQILGAVNTSNVTLAAASASLQGLAGTNGQILGALAIGNATLQNLATTTTQLLAAAQATTLAVQGLSTKQQPSGADKPSVGYDGDPEARTALWKIVDLNVLQNELLKAVISILTTTATAKLQVPKQQQSGGRQGPDMDALFAKYFGKDNSDHVDPQKGLGRYAGKKLGRAYRKSRTARYGKGGAKIAMGAARSLGRGKGTVAKAGAVGAVVGKVIGTVTTLVDLLFKAHGAIASWTDAAMETAAKLSQVSGGMAAVTAQRELDQIYRDIERGSQTSESAGRLQEAESARKDQENKIAIAVDNATNNVLTVLNKLATPVLEGINNIVDAVKGVPGLGDIIREWLEGGREADGGIHLVGGPARAEAAGMEARGRALLDIARAAGGAAGGVRPPDGAAPVRRLP